MNASLQKAGLAILMLVVINASAATRYVNVNNSTPTAPYTNWLTAATNIQDAIDFSSPGDQVLVTNGVYETGGRVAPVNSLQARAALVIPITVQSVNGPLFTTIKGDPVGPVRGVYLTNGASLIGFSITNGGASGGDIVLTRYGAGAWCESTTAVISNCIIIRNSASAAGGAVFRGTINNCIIASNTVISGSGAVYQGVLNNSLIYSNVVANTGGGIEDCTAINCTISGNTAGSGGGASFSRLKNSIVYFNFAGSFANYASSTFTNSCTTPLPSGVSNIISAPLFVDQAARDYRLQSGSPCRDSGNNGFVTTALDLDDTPRIQDSIVDIGAYEFPGVALPVLSVIAEYTHTVPGLPLTFLGDIPSGNATNFFWDFGDGTTSTGNLTVSHSWALAGDYSVVLWAFNQFSPTGVNVTVNIRVVENLLYHVNVQGTNPIAPYLSWSTAATNIQDAIDAALPDPSALILVTNGIYQTGGKIIHGALSNRVAVTKPITLRSLNGPEATIIAGNSPPGTNAVRCAYLTNGAYLVGFTLTNGATRITGDDERERRGGGVWSESTSGVISNCVVTGNRAATAGGGAYRGQLNNCTLTFNIVTNGGAASQSVLNNCVLAHNQAANAGGGAHSSTLNNCTVTENSAAGDGGGVSGGTINNSILYFNTAPSNPNQQAATLNFSCTTPLPGTGANNFTNTPLFVSPSTDDFRLQSTSFCINAGTNGFVTTTLDRDGNPRIIDDIVDVGAYEFQSFTPLLATIDAEYTNTAPGLAVPLFGWVNGGPATSTTWDFGDGTFATNVPATTHSWAAVGSYAVVFRAYDDENPAGVSATVMVHVATQHIYYVAAAAVNPIPPFNSWATAASNIQDALDVAVPSPTSLILVSNGLYDTGGRIVNGASSNRVAVTKPVTLRSVNGPAVTTIKGNPQIGDSAARCVYLTNGASLSGFTLTGGATPSAFNTENRGGGVWCESTNAIISQCVVTGNVASASAGGIFRGTLNSCLIAYNASSGSGGGATESVLNNCTVIDNSAVTTGGGLESAIARNSIVYFNAAPTGTNFISSSLDFSCTFPRPSGGLNNFTNSPLLVDAAAGNFRLATNSPCLNNGDNASVATSLDLDANPRITDSIVDRGAYELPIDFPLLVAIDADATNTVPLFAIEFRGSISGAPIQTSFWDFGDGTVISNNLTVSHAWASTGAYPVVLRVFDPPNPGGISVTVTVFVATALFYHVDAHGTNPVVPFNSWSTAATNIQDAIDAALPSPASLIQVTNGTYDSGGRVISVTSNRVAVTKPVRIQSVNGPAVTIIKGNRAVANSAVRCVYLTNGATLTGFTLTNGSSRSSGDTVNDRYGGGLWCESVSVVVSNCILVGNSGNAAAGGSFRGTLDNCVLANNTTPLGSGGGAYLSVINNGLIASNSAANTGGGVESCTLNNCTVSGNSAGGGGGAWFSTLRNCILYFNSAGNGPNYVGSSLSFCCTTPLPPSSPGTFTNAPVFVNPAGGDFHLQVTSPCINSGSNAFAILPLDLDGNPRIVAGAVDIGAYEHQAPLSSLPQIWLVQQGVTIEPSVDQADPDADGMSNWEEWRAGTTPTDASSLLLMFPPATNAPGLLVSWKSVTGRTYFLERSTDLAVQPFSVLKTNLIGLPGTTTYSDTNATGPGPYFYRVGVQ